MNEYSVQFLLNFDADDSEFFGFILRPACILLVVSWHPYYYLVSGKFQKQRSYEHTSVFDAVMLSIENLNEYHKTLYKSLAVFLDDVGIPSKVRYFYISLFSDFSFSHFPFLFSLFFLAFRFHFHFFLIFPVFFCFFFLAVFRFFLFCSY